MSRHDTDIPGSDGRGGAADIFVLMPPVAEEADTLREHDPVPCLFDSDGIDQWIGSAPALALPAGPQV